MATLPLVTLRVVVVVVVVVRPPVSLELYFCFAAS